MRDAYYVAAAAFLLLILGATFLVPVPQPRWEHDVVENGKAGRFVSLALGDGDPHIVFRDRKDGGLRYATTVTDASLVDAILDRNVTRTWKVEIVDASPKSGLFPSVTMIGGTPHVSYQDGTLGQERLLHATPGNESWLLEQVDTRFDSGISTGMYASATSYHGRPVIFYHVAQGRKLKIAEKQDDAWSHRVLERGTGWLIDTASCGSKVSVGYRNRDNNTVRIGSYDGSWTSRMLEATTLSGIAVALQGCTPYLAYFDDTAQQILFGRADTSYAPVTVGPAAHSRVSAATDSGFHLTYFYDERGLVYASSPDGQEWNRTFIDTNKNAGAYNDIAVHNGNIHIAYTNETELAYATYRAAPYRAVTTILFLARFLVGLGLVLLAAIRYGLGRRRIEKVIKHIKRAT